MGETGRIGPSPEDSSITPPAIAAPTSAPVVALHGADLYRLNCRGCHGEQGLGAPPEIGSVINPVRATSTAMVFDRMKSTGANITHAQATELARQAKTTLLQRIHQGGQDMPPFSHLNDAEVSVLISYLEQLAGVPSAADKSSVPESRERIGEMIVKSTCHVCHDAAGSNPAAAELAAGAIPPLSTLPARTGPDGLIRKVTLGSPILMGSPAMAARGRMPVFDYLSAAEAADVYDYLTTFPPRESDDKSAPSAQNLSALISVDHLPPNAGPPSSSGASPARPTSRPAQEASAAPYIWMACLSLLALAVLGGGFAFTLLKFKLLSPAMPSSADAPLLEFPLDRPARTVTYTPPVEAYFPPRAT